MRKDPDLDKQQTAIVNYFCSLTETRRTNKGNFQHLLTDIIFLVISAVISGSNDWKSIEIFGKSQLRWLRKFGSYKNGVPSHDTIERVFIALDTNEFGLAVMVAFGYKVSKPKRPKTRRKIEEVVEWVN